jgi:hypothetical protein
MARSNFVSDMANELRRFKKLLEDNMGGYLLNPGVLETAIAKVKDPSKPSWGYDIPRLEFVNLDLGRVVCPNLHEDFLKNAVLELKLNISCLSNMPDPIDDPIKDFGIQIIVKIRTLEKVIAKNAWHFEPHPAVDDNGNPSKQPEFHHPLYHLHFGGYELTNETEGLQYGNILILEAPRIMHPPMDIVLAIDFVLNNFYSYHSCQPLINLTSEPDYIRIVKNARERFWKPFAFGLASNFATNHNFWSINQVSVNPTYAKNLLTYSEKH